MRTAMWTAVGFALAVHLAEAWVLPDRDNRRSDAPFAAAVNVNAADGSPVYVIGPGLREDVLFYLGRTVPVLSSPDELPAGYRGYAIVTAEQVGPVRLSNRADEVATSADRPEKEKLYLFKFPRSTVPLQPTR
jgi:hypothetical protein